jgi:hypothetical protein
MTPTAAQVEGEQNDADAVRQQFEDEQGLLRADPACNEWLDQLELKLRQEHEHD